MNRSANPGGLIRAVLMAAIGSAATGLACAAGLEECKVRGIDRPVLCGSVMVPQDPGDPANGTRKLKVVVIPAIRQPAEPDPVFYLVGGPGSAATDSASFFGDSLRGLQERRDIVLVDLRGTGGSDRFDCDFSDYGARIEALLSGRIPQQVLQSCAAKAPQPTRFHSTSVAAEDLDAVRRSLGYERINLIGASYGTRLALAYARRHPGATRTMVLRGVAGPDGKVPLDVPRNSAGVLGRILDTPDDEDDHPDAKRVAYHKVLERLEATPAHVSVRKPGGEKVTVSVTHEVFEGVVMLLLYGRETAHQLPALIAATLAGDLEPLSQAVGRLAPLIGGLPVGMYLSIICTEDAPFIGDEDVGPYALTRNLVSSCRSWPVAPVPDGFKDPVVSKVPALLLSGADDPATSAEQGRQVAANLGDSLHIIMPRLGHFPAWTDCFARAATRAVEQGGVDGIETSCPGAMASRGHGKLGTTD